MFHNLILNAALLVTLVTFHNLLARARAKDRLWAKIVSGLLFGGAAIAGMNIPFQYSTGIIYDGRSIVMIISGLFGGGITALTSIGVAGAFRAYLGGNGIWAGILTIISCALAGLVFRRITGNRPDRLSIPALYGIGIAGHLAMLMSQLLIIPWPTGPAILGKIWMPVLSIFPIATMVMGILLRDTERRIRMETTILESEEKFRAMTALSPAAIAILKSDEKGERFLYVNAAWETMTGYCFDEAMQIKPKDILHPDLREQIWEQSVRRTHGEDAPSRYENKIITKNGETKWLDFAAVVIQYRDERAILTMALDITERKRAEEKLIESEKRLALVMEGSQLGYWDWNIKTGEVQRNARWAEMLGYTLPEIELNVKQWADLHHPDDQKAALKSIQDHLEGRTPQHRIEYRMRCKNGKYKWILDQAKIVERDAQGNPLRMSGTHTDITERKQAEEELNEREHLFRTLFESSPNAILLLDPHNPDISWPVVDCNEEACRMNGYAREELIGQSIDLLNVTPGSREERRDYVNRLREKGSVYLETFHKRKDGSIFPIEVTTSFVTLRNRELLLGIDRDITERKRAEEALKESEMFFKNIFEHHAAIELIIDPNNGSIIDANEAAINYYGWPLEQFRQKKIQDINILSSDEVKTAMKKVQENQQNHFEFRHKKADGSIRDVDVYTSLFEYKGHKILHSIVHDISDRKRAEEALRESEERFRIAQAIGHVGNWEYNLQTTHFWGSEEAKRIYGFDPEQSEMSTEDVEKCIPERERVHQALVDLIEKGKPYDLEFEIHPLNSSEPKIIASVAELMRDEQGKPLKVMGVIQDITARKRMEDALRDSEIRFRTLFQSAAEGILMTEIETRKFSYANPALCQFLGYSKEEMEQMSLTDIHPKADLDHILNEINALIRGEKNIAERIPCLRKDGAIRYADIRTSRMTIHEKEFLVGFFSDITKRKEAEEALQRSERKFAAAFYQSNIVMTFAQLNSGRFVDVNDNFCECVGYSHSEILGKSAVELGLFGTASNRQKMAETAKTKGSIKNMEIDFYRRNGEKRRGLFSGTYIELEGEPYLFTTMVDITERKLVEEALNQKTALLEAQLNSSIDGILVVDRDGKQILQNQRVIELWKIPKEIADNPDDQIQVNHVMKLTKDPDQFVSKIQYLYNHPDETSWDEVMLTDGTTLERYSAPVIGSDGKNFGRIWSFRDITESKRAEEQIRKDLEERGVLLREIHHRVKNNLSVMSSLLNLQARQITTKQQALEAFKESRDRVSAMALVHEKLYQSNDFASVDIKSYLDEMSHQLIKIYNINSRIRLVLDVEDIKININSAIPTGLILNELITNAFKYAFPDKREGKITVSLKLFEKKSYELIVSDNGIGIPEHINPMESESLGLTLIQGLTEQLNAVWTFERDHGTTFRIIIPKYEKKNPSILDPH